jgi:hypothetical protein
MSALCHQQKRHASDTYRSRIGDLAGALPLRLTVTANSRCQSARPLCRFTIVDCLLAGGDIEEGGVVCSR